ncbi:choice-of-anchor D domain-containing protein [Brevifollis gellanilyticus]|uniref:Cadherin domain-containing protein n=1 Tax=Brevifollis gellanilyticus TaxID=748831 RepID=A0A512M4E2_9BACT|nr:choice-of-anchor D domain-containing protein [Brevifollis gellanilyticus]GEP41609.1 hypothetical protein BGE01nite_09000 [Brevifollis gellanilyticus]
MSGIAEAVALEPEISVTGNGISIVNGDMVPTVDDHTDFGDVPAEAASVIRTFTIHNDGTATLQPGSVKVTGGVPASEFTVSQQPAPSVLPGESTIFQISCQPGLLGLRTATVSFSSNDVDEAAFSFAIRARSTGPEPLLSGNGQNIIHWDYTPRPEDHTNFGSTAVGVGSITRTFTLQNIGESDLTVASVLFTSGNASVFSLSRAPASLVPPGGSTTFDLTFTSTRSMVASATVTITTNGVNTPGYMFNIQAIASGAEIGVTGDLRDIVNGDSTPYTFDNTDFGNVVITGSSVRGYLIRNYGSQPLTLSDITITGAHAGDFSITQMPSSPISSLDTVIYGLGIQFKPTIVGTRSAIVTIGNNDYDENPFTFSIQGTGTNLAPTNITLGNSSIAEANFPGTLVGQFAATDPDAGQSHVFSLVAGAGDEGNSAFAISGNRLLARVATDFETQNSYSIRMRVEDNANPPLAFEKKFTITVTDVNEAALAIAQKAFFKGSNTEAGDWFGGSVSVSGDTVVVGAKLEDSSSAGVNSTPDEGATAAGAAYVFVRADGVWTQQAYLKASNPGVHDWFGASVAISGNTIIIGAPDERSSSTGVNSLPNDNAPGAGAAYIFARQDGIWTQQAYLKASNSGTTDRFGSDVAISGDSVIVGAYGEDSSTSGVNSAPNEGAASSGAAYIFTRSGGTWIQEAYLKASFPRTNDFAGSSVAISGDTAVMGVPYDDSDATGVNGVAMYASEGDSGAVYVFKRGTSGTWSQEAYIKASNRESVDGFGSSVAMSGSTLIVGAPNEGSSTKGVNSTPNDNTPGAGAAYIFTRQAGLWSQQAYLKASNTGYDDKFGRVAVSGDTAVVGAGGEDNINIGVNGFENYEGAANSGAAYIFKRTGTTWAQQAYVKSHNTGAGDYFGGAETQPVGSVAVSGEHVLIGAQSEDSSTTSINGMPDELAADAGAAYAYNTPLSLELALSGNDVQITDGDTTPSLADHTQFGDVSTVFGSLTRTFVLQNMGTVSLTLNDFVVSGVHAGDFTLSQLPATSLAGGDITLLRVTFSPSGIGLRNATLRFTSNDADEGAFNFNLQGNGVEADVEVRGNSVFISNGDATPSLANGTDFGRAVWGAGPVEHTFVISNVGSSNLEISNLTITGSQAAHFRLHKDPSSTVMPGSGTTFEIWYLPDVGVQRATVSFTTNDPDEQSYSFEVWGSGYMGTRSAQTVTFNPPATLFVNQGPLSLSASASSGLPVTFSIVSGPATLQSGNVLTLTGTGSVKISASQTGNSGYREAPTLTKAIVIKPVPTAPMLVDLNQTYNGLPRSVSVIGASSAPVITYTINKAATNSPPVNAGSYPVKVVVDGKTLAGSLVIAKAPLLVATDSHRRFIGQANPALTVNYSGFAGNDTESSVFAATGAKRPILKTTATPASAGGLYPITASGAVMLNYVPVYANGQMLVETFAGAYEALLTGTDTLPAAKVEFTVTASSTALSGKLTVPGEAAPMSFNGTLMVNSGEEKATGAIKPVTKNGKTYAVTFDLPFGMDFQSQMRINDVLTAETHDGKKIYTPPAGRTLYDIGAYTMILATALPAGSDVPAGSGHATVTIDSKLVLKVAGRLADGTTLTASLQPNGYVELGYQLFAQPYARAGSYLAGWLDFENHPGPLSQRYIPASAGCDFAWAKTGRATDKSYRDDFGPVLTRMTVDPWIPPTKTETLASLLGLSGTPTLDVSHGGFGSAAVGNLPVEVTLNAANKLVVTQATNSTKWTATITPATGAFAGSFELLDAGKKRTVPFTGVLRQPHGTGGRLGAGHALVPALPTDLTNETISGAVRFDP